MWAHEPITSSYDELEAYTEFVKKMGGREYDTKAVGWLSVDSILKKLRIRNPYKENKWGSKEAVYCQEVLSAFEGIFRISKC